MQPGRAKRSRNSQFDKPSRRITLVGGGLAVMNWLPAYSLLPAVQAEQRAQLLARLRLL